MAYVTSLLVLTACLVLPALSQVTFSKSWVPQGKRASSPSRMTAALEVPDSCREAKLALLSGVSNVVMAAMEEVTQESAGEALPTLRLKNALMHRKRRMS